MKRAQIIGLSVAGVSALLTFITVKAVLRAPPPEKPVEQVTLDTVRVLVARADIGLGQMTSEGLFRWQTWPREAAQGFITDEQGPGAMRELSDAIARAPILAGEPITPVKLVKAGDGGVLAAILPQGMRAISTKIKEETAVGNLILPNDHVDIILTRRSRSKTGGEDYVSDTLLRNVRVLPVGQQIETKEGKKSAEGNANTATLELTPAQAETLALANSLGEISLSLRSIADLDRTGPEQFGTFHKPKTVSAVRVMRYGVSSRSSAVN